MVRNKALLIKYKVLMQRKLNLTENLQYHTHLKLLLTLNLRSIVRPVEVHSIPNQNNQLPKVIHILIPPQI